MIALLLGFVTTVLVAQLIALFGSIDRLTIPDQPPEYGANHVPGYIKDITPPFRIAQWAAPVDDPRGYVYNYLEIGTDIVEYSFGNPFINWDQSVHGDMPPAVYITRCFVGLPFRCMYYDNFAIAPSGGSKVLAYFDLLDDNAGIRTGLPSPRPSPMTLDRRIPLSPVWGGILANALFFGLCFYLPVAIPRVVRHRTRQKRGLCFACGYAVEDLEVCPECGSDHAAS